MIEDRGLRIEDRRWRIEDRGLKIEDRPFIYFSILYSPSSILLLNPQSQSAILGPFIIVEPATRFELVFTAYETVALPIELRRQILRATIGGRPWSSPSSRGRSRTFNIRFVGPAPYH